MRFSALYCLLAALLIFSCSPRSNSLSSGKIVISHQETEKLGNDLITFTVRNNSQETLTLVNPQSVNIEFKDGTDWKPIRYLDCPCGASCARPLGELRLEANKPHELNWNKKDEWCGEQKTGARPETFSLDAQKGKYRIKVSYRMATSEVQSEYYQFKIK